MNKDEKLIAVCGMNCGICSAYLREKNKCPGCRLQPIGSCRKCIMRSCENRTGDFCYSCAEFPCTRLKNLDKRYRTKYNLSEIKNLEMIRDYGMDELLKKEEKKWACPKCSGVVSCHTNKCIVCGKNNIHI